MAKDELTEILMFGAVIVGGYYLYKEGIVGQVFDELTKVVGTLPSLPGLGTGGGAGAGVGGGAAAGGSTGSCSGGPYKSTGKTVTTSTRGPTTRHYASGKPDDDTIEKNAKGVSFKNYQFVSYVTIKSIEHNDFCSVKLGGTHSSGWYDHGIDFNSGQGCLGTEKSHPHTNSCVVKGKSIGKIVGKKIGIAGVMINGNTEVWGDGGSGWQKLASGTNVDGFKPKSGSHECQLRIDGFKDLEIHCSNVQEIAGTAAAAAPYQQSYATTMETNTLPPLMQDQINYRFQPHRQRDCGRLCWYESPITKASTLLGDGWTD